MILTTAIDYLGDIINPIAMKEMRQAVKGRILTWMLILFLLAQLVIMGGGILINELSGDDFNSGPALLSVLLVALLSVCLLFLPAIFGIRLSAERSQRRIDLLFITDMSPYSIIWGKTLAGIVLTLLLFSASMPFLTLTYLLRGIDLPSIFIVMGLNFIVVILTIQGALLLACFPGGMISRGIRFLMGLGGAIFVLSTMISASFAILQSGMGSLLGTWDFWGPALTIVGFILMGMGFLFVLAAVAISPPSSNRAPLIRLYLCVIWCCCTLAAILWYRTIHEEEIFAVWLVSMLILFGIVFVASLSERHHYGLRLRRKIPRRVLFRWPAFLLYSGSAAGVLFSVLMMALTVGIFLWISTMSSQLSRLTSDEEVVWMITASCLYLICYGLSALGLRRLIIPDHTSNIITVIFAFILLALGSLLPLLFAWFFIHRDIDKVSEMWYLGNPLMVFLEPKMLDTTLGFTSVWALVVLGLNAPWFIRQIRGFTPLPVEKETEIANAETKDTNE